MEPHLQHLMHRPRSGPEMAPPCPVRSLQMGACTCALAGALVMAMRAPSGGLFRTAGFESSGGRPGH